MAKGEISWNRTTEEGGKIQVYAHHVGDRWIFYRRERRFEVWKELDDPPLEDWLELLDGVQRRISRRLIRPEEEHSVKKTIKERYPETNIS